MRIRRKPITLTNKVEDILWEYKSYKRELNQLRNEILFGTPSYENTGGGRANTTSDQTGLKVSLLVDHRRIKLLELFIEAIESEFDKLPPERKKFIQIRYWSADGRNSPKWEVLATKFHVNRATALRWRDEFCMSVGKRIGY